MDSVTGIFSLKNDAAIKRRYEVEIDIITTDGVNEYLQTIVGVSIDIVCGPESTKLIAPVMSPLSKAPNTQPYLVASGTFESSNPLCPVIDL